MERDVKFFKPEDFDGINFDNKFNHRFADAANAKIESDGGMVYSSPGTSSWTHVPTMSDTHKAYVVNVRPIENCKHPKEQIMMHNQHTTGQMMFSGYVPGSVEAGVPIEKLPKPDYFCCMYYQCSCGVRVEPDSFKEVDKVFIKETSGVNIK